MNDYHDWDIAEAMDERDSEHIAECVAPNLSRPPDATRKDFLSTMSGQRALSCVKLY